MTPEEFAAKVSAYGQIRVRLASANPDDSYAALDEGAALATELYADYQRLTDALAAAQREGDEIGEQLDMAAEDHANELAAACGERDGWKVDAEKHQAERDAAQADAYRARAELSVVQSMRDEAQVEAGRLRAENEQLAFQLREVRAQQVEDFQRAEKLKREATQQQADHERLLLAISMSAGLAGEITYGDLPKVVQGLKADLAQARSDRDRLSSAGAVHRAEFARLMNAIAPFVGMPQFTDWAKVEEFVDWLIDKVGGLATRAAQPTPSPGSLEDRVRRLEKRLFQEAQS